MSDIPVNKVQFDELFEYFFDFEEMMEDYENGRIDTKRFEGDGFEVHERIGHKFAAMGDPGWSIYEMVDESGEAEVLLELTEDLMEKGEEEHAGHYWRQFQEVDSTLRNPEEEIYSPLRDAGMNDDEVAYLEDEYQEHIEPLLDGTMFEDN